MNRVIKFRAWDDISQSMLYWKELIKNKIRLEYFEGETNLKWMQFTGLLDKNGKEIYEGDIVTFTDGNYHPILLVKWFDSLTWDSGGSSHPGFFFKQKWHDESNECDMDYHSGFDVGLEVIGNTHENPELLNQTGNVL